MFQCDAVDTNTDLGGQNVLKTSEMTIRHESDDTNGTEESLLSLDLFSLSSKVFFWLLLGGHRPHRPHRPHESVTASVPM